MKILALDPATTTGWALYDGSSISETGYITFAVTENEGDRLLEAHRFLKDLIYTWKPDAIIAEGYFSRSKFQNATAVNFELRGVFKMTAAESSVPYSVFQPTEWKMITCGRARPTPKQKRKYRNKEVANKMMTVEALAALGCVMPATVKSKKTGKPVKFKFDVSDALGILTARLKKLGLAILFSPDLFSKT